MSRMPKISQKDFDEAFGDERRREVEDRARFLNVPDQEHYLKARYFVLRVPTLRKLHLEVGKMLEWGFRPQGGVQVVYRQLDTGWKIVEPDAWYVQAMFCEKKEATG